MAYQPKNPNGQTTMANSEPVVIASDQSPIDVLGPLTDAELRASPVDVIGPLTDVELRDSPVPVSGPLTDTELRATSVNVSIVSANSSSVTSIASSATNVTLVAANLDRRGLIVYNDSSAVLFLKLGATATSSSFSVKLAANSLYELSNSYTGIVDGIWDSATGFARITEIQ